MLMIPLVVLTLVLGVYPALVLDIIGPSVAHLLNTIEPSLTPALTPRFIWGRGATCHHFALKEYDYDTPKFLPRFARNHPCRICFGCTDGWGLWAER